MKEKIQETLSKLNTCKIQEMLSKLNTYKTLFWLWLVLGIVDLTLGNISRVTFFSVWILLLLEYADDAWREENRRR